MAAVIVGAWTPSACAAEPGDVEELIREGVELRREGKDQWSLPLFQKAYRLAPTPRTAAQLGLVEMALGYRLEAEGHLTDALGSPRDVWVGKNRKTLEGALSKVRSAIGEVLVTGSPIGAEVTLNGKAVGRLPLAAPIRVGEGPTTVELRAPGYESASRSVAVLGGRREEVNVALVGEPAARLIPTERPPLLTPEPVTTHPAVTPDQPISADSRDHSGSLRVAAWVTAAGTVAAGSLALSETAIWRSKSNQFDNQIGLRPDNPNVVGLNCAEQVPHRGGQGCERLYDDMRQAKTFAVVGYAVAGALAVGSIVLFSISASQTEPTSSVTLCCSVGFSPAAVCRVTF